MNPRLLLLGGLRYLLPVIKAAHELGAYVITADYLPNNFAHKFADEYCNVSIIDQEAVLTAAEQLKIDGIMSFAVDPGVLSAAYVAEQLGLPGCPYESVKILQNKALFRKYLSDNGFVCPNAKGYHDCQTPMKEIDMFHWPVIVKPTDSAGSKGVIKVNTPDQLKKAIEYALQASFSHEVIVEDYLEQQGFSSDTDSFSVNNELQFVSFSNQHFDGHAANPLTPSGYSWPSSMSEKSQTQLAGEIQRLIRLLNLGTSVYNIETRECTDGKAYIMELSPRGGGNRLCEMLKFATGTDLIMNAVKAALGMSIDNLPPCRYDGHWAEVILHSDQSGIFDSLDISPTIAHKYLVERDLWIKKGDIVKGFNGANEAIGTLILNFDSEEQLEEQMRRQEDWIKVNVR